MPEKTIPQIFGTGATRLASQEAAPSAGLFIPDSAMIAVGLSPGSATAEGHVVALMLIMQANLSRAGFDADTDQSIYVEQGYPTFSFRGSNNTSYRVDELSVNFAKLDIGSTIDPDNY